MCASLLTNIDEYVRCLQKSRRSVIGGGTTEVKPASLKELYEDLGPESRTGLSCSTIVSPDVIKCLVDGAKDSERMEVQDVEGEGSQGSQVKPDLVSAISIITKSSHDATRMTPPLATFETALTGGTPETAKSKDLNKKSSGKISIKKKPTNDTFNMKSEKAIFFLKPTKFKRNKVS